MGLIFVDGWVIFLFRFKEKILFCDCWLWSLLGHIFEFYFHVLIIAVFWFVEILLDFDQLFNVVFGVFILFFFLLIILKILVFYLVSLLFCLEFQNVLEFGSFCHFLFAESFSESLVPAFAEVKLISSWNLKVFHDLFGLHENEFSFHFGIAENKLCQSYLHFWVKGPSSALFFL